MILVMLIKIKMQINWASVLFNNLHNRLWNLGGPHKYGATKDVEFKGAQILDIMFRKWFLVDSNFQVLDLKEEDELEENLPGEAKRGNLLPSLSV